MRLIVFIQDLSRAGLNYGLSWRVKFQNRNGARIASGKLGIGR